MTITSSGSCFALHARRFFLVSTSKREVSKYLNTTRSTTSFRFHSSNISSSSSSSSVSTNKCPHSSGTNNNDNAAAKAAAIDAVKLVNVPKLPFLGSMIPQYSKTEKRLRWLNYQLQALCPTAPPLKLLQTLKR